MKKYTTAQRLRQIMGARNLRQVDVLKAAEPYCKKYNVPLSKNTLSQYIAGRFEPGQRKLTILGLALGVSEAWLMGFDVPMERAVAPAVANPGDGRTQEFIELFSLLTADQQALVVRQIKGILADR